MRTKRIRFDVSLETVVLAVLSVAAVWLFLQLWPIAEERRDEQVAKGGDAVEIPFSTGLSDRV